MPSRSCAVHGARKFPKTKSLIPFMMISLSSHALGTKTRIRLAFWFFGSEQYLHETVMVVPYGGLDAGCCGVQHTEMTPLHWAASDGHLDLVSLLLSFKASMRALTAVTPSIPILFHSTVPMRRCCDNDCASEPARQHGSCEGEKYILNLRLVVMRRPVCPWIRHWPKQKRLTIESRIALLFSGAMGHPVGTLPLLVEWEVLHDFLMNPFFAMFFCVWSLLFLPSPSSRMQNVSSAVVHQDRRFFTLRTVEDHIC